MQTNPAIQQVCWKLVFVTARTKMYRRSHCRHWSQVWG